MTTTRNAHIDRHDFRHQEGGTRMTKTTRTALIVCGIAVAAALAATELIIRSIGPIL